MLKSMARKKAHTGKLNVRLPRSLNASFRSWIEGAADGYKYFNRRMGVEPCVGAIVNHFMRALTEEERHTLVRLWLADLEVLEAAESGLTEQSGEGKLTPAGLGERMQVMQTTVGPKLGSVSPVSASKDADADSGIKHLGDFGGLGSDPLPKPKKKRTGRAK